MEAFLRKILSMMTVGTLLFASVAFSESNFDQGVLDRDGDSWVPWPWAFETPFPWNEIEGTWKITNGNNKNSSDVYFTMRIHQKPSQMEPTLIVSQLQGGARCLTIARGVGSESENIIKVYMTSSKGPFTLLLRSFDLKDIPAPVQESLPSRAPLKAIVATVVDIVTKVETHYQVTKVSPVTTKKACLAAMNKK